MSSQQNSQPIHIDGYEFYDFENYGFEVKFKVTTKSSKINDLEDKIAVKRILDDDLGKWENLDRTIKADLFLLSELGITQPKPNIEANVLQSFDEPFGEELYKIDVNNMHKETNSDGSEYLSVHIYLDDAELEKRRKAHASEFPAKEMEEQIRNIQKWKVIKKSIKTLREELFMV